VLLIISAGDIAGLFLVQGEAGQRARRASGAVPVLSALTFGAQSLLDADSTSNIAEGMDGREHYFEMIILSFSFSTYASSVQTIGVRYHSAERLMSRVLQRTLLFLRTLARR
jgi:hypothetical protein